MADPRDPDILRDAEGFPFPDADESARDRDAARDAARAARGIARGEPVVPSELDDIPTGDEAGDGRVRCPRGEVWSYSERKCVPDDNPDNFDNPDFDFMDCEPSDANLEPPEECAVCEKDPLAFVPSWKRLANKEVFFDGKECLYSAVVHDINLDSWQRTMTRPGTTTALAQQVRKKITVSDPDGDAKIAGLELMFEFLQKAEVVKAAEFLPKEETGVGQVTSGLFPFLPGAKESGKYTREEKDINMIDELLKLKDIVQVESVVSIRPNIPTKFLISVPVEYIIDLPNVVVAGIPEDIPTDEPLKVQFTGDDIKEKFQIMANPLNGVMMVYHRQYQIWLRQGGGVFKKTKYNDETQRFEVTGKNFKLDLKDHAGKMRDFLDSLSEMLSTQNLVIPGSGTKLRTQAPNVEKVIVNIENTDKAPGGKLRIKNVKANKKGCELVVFNEKRPATSYQFKKFERQFRNTTLLGYIGQIPSMCDSSQARDPSEWFDWAVEHTYPPVEVQLGLNADDASSEQSFASCAAGGLIFDPIEEILGSLGEELGKVLKEKFGAGEILCLSPEEAKAEMKESRDATKLAKAEAEEARRVWKIAKDERKETEKELKELYKKAEAMSVDEFGDVEDVTAAQDIGMMIQALEDMLKDLQKTEDAAKKDLKEKKVFLSKDLTERMRGTFKEEMSTYAAKNPLFESLPKLLDSFAKKGKGSKKNLWKDVIKKLGPCGLLALLAEAMKCLMEGMGLDDAKKKLVEAAFKAMDNANLEKIFIGLPPEEQAAVMAEIEKELKGVKPPWEDPYKEGTYSGSGWNKDDLRNDVLQAQGGKTTDEIRAEAKEAGESYNKAIKAEVDKDDMKSARKARRADTAAKLFGEDGHVLPGGGVQQHPKQGSLAMAVNDAQKIIFEAYKKAILKLIGADYLFEQLEKLPGAALIAALIKDIPCKKPPPWRIDPPLGEFFHFGNLNPCDLKNTTGVWQIPPRFYFRKPVNLWWMAAYLWYILKEIAEEMIFMAALLIFKAIIDIIIRLICLALSALGAALKDLLTGSNSLMDMLKDELCGAGAKDELLEESITNLIETLSGPDASCLETMDPGDIGDFIDSISATLLQNEILDLLNGSASPDVLEMVSQLAMMSGSPCIAEIFGDPQNVADLFNNLGNLVDLSELENLVSQLEGDPTYINPSICADPLALENVDKIRCYLLSGKGLTEEECQEEIDKLKNQALDDLGTLADALHGNFPGGPPLNSTGPNPCGPEDGIFPYNSPASLSAAQAVTDAMFEDLAIAHSRDLLGAGGFLNMILADTNGKGLKAHNFWVKFFGSSEARYLSTIQWYTDDAITQLKGPGNTEAPLSRGGKVMTGKEGNGNSFFNGIPGVNVTTGGFPPTVASWLKKSLTNLGSPTWGDDDDDDDDDRIYQTATVPGGYNSIEEANAAERERAKTNQYRYNIRSDYIEAFIDEYDLDLDTDRTGNKRSTSSSKLRAGIEIGAGPLFVKNVSLEEYYCSGYADCEGYQPDDISKNDSRHLAREVLRGKQILGGVGHKFTGTGRKNLDKKWSKKNRRRAAKSSGRNMLSTYFTQAYPSKQWEYLPDLDLSSADLRLTFEDYLGEYGLKVEYDPNPVDADTMLMSFPRTVTTKYPAPRAREGIRIDAQGDEFVGPADDSYILSIYEMFDSRTPETANTPGDGVALPPGGLKTDTGYIRTHKLKGSSLTDPEVVEFIEETLNINTEMEKIHFGTAGFDIADKTTGLSKQGITFTTLIKNALLERGVGDDTGQQFGFLLRQNENLIELNIKQRGNRFDEISDYYVKQIANRISQNSRAFDFGWQASDKPKIKMLDPEKYGGTPEAPPFYLQPPNRPGWLGLVDDILPEWDGCEPRSTDLINFNSLKKLVDDRNQSLTEDPRLESDPLCINEAPYDKILDKFSFASIEGVIAATIRIYAAEMLLQGMPVFSLFHARIPENFDDVFLGYLVDKMEAGLIDEGTKFNLFKGQVIDKSYWYQFVEMAVQSFITRLPEEYNPAGNGELTDLTPLEIKAYTNIAAAVETFYHIERFEYDPKGQGYAALTNNAINGQSLIKRIMESRPTAARMAKNAPAGQFSKADAKYAKELAFETILEETMDDAKIILRRLIREELERLAEQFNEAIKPSIYSMDSLLLGNSDFIDGSLTDNKGNYRDPLPVQTTDAGEAPADARDTRGAEGYERDFVLQKYIRIIDKENPDARIEEGRTPEMYNVVNIDAWHRHVDRLSRRGVRGKISEYWGDLETVIDPDRDTIEEEREFAKLTKKQATFQKLGRVLSDEDLKRLEELQALLETFGQEIEVGESGWRFGVRICYVAKPSRFTPGRSEEAILRSITGDAGITQAMNEKAFKGDQILIPVAHGELEIPDQEFTNFDPDSYDIDCLIAELIKDPAYKTLFNYCFPLKTFLSTLTIYCIKAFVPSIGNTGDPKDGGDRWVVPGGRSMSGFRRWDGKKEPFRKSTKKARQMFEVLYNASTKDNSYKDREDNGEKQKWWKKLAPKWNYDVGLRWWMMPRMRSRPYDKNGNECE